jgi:hypothetical protein
MLGKQIQELEVIVTEASNLLSEAKRKLKYGTEEEKQEMEELITELMNKNAPSNMEEV